MKILITGGTGFVGQHLQQVLRERGDAFFVFGRLQFDLTVAEQADALFEQHRDADAVIHMASCQAAGDFPARHTGDQFHVNSRIHLNTLEAWRRLLPRAKLLAVGSSCAYPPDRPLLEENFDDGAIHGSVYAYAFTKRLLYQGIRAYNDQYGLDGSFVIPATMFGEHDDFCSDTAHVVGALIGKFVRASIENRPEVEIWGDGSQVRDFMDVRGFVQLLVELLGRVERALINVGPGEGTSIRQLAQMIAGAAGYPHDIRYNRQKYVGVAEKVIDVTKLRSQFGLEVSADHRAAIKRTVDWYRENYDELKERRKQVFAAGRAA